MGGEKDIEGVLCDFAGTDVGARRRVVDASPDEVARPDFSRASKKCLENGHEEAFGLIGSA